jgi:hypothetical protein
MYIYARSGGEELRQPMSVDGWRNFREPTIARIKVSDGTVTIGAYVSCDANGWVPDDFIPRP